MSSREAAKEVRLHEELPFNLHLIIAETIDDYWAAYLCFLNGFTKQSQQILRNTLELVIQVYYLDHLYRTNGSPRDSWTDASRGIERVPDKIKAARKLLEASLPGSASRLTRLYDLLCMSTHSHKGRMAVFRMPRAMLAGDMPSIEPTEVLYSRALFLSILDLELRLLRSILSAWNDDHWRMQVQQVFDRMLHLVSKYKRVIDAFHKGYLIHREHAVISDRTQILYSIKLNGQPECPGRQRPITRAQADEFRRYVENRLLQDKT